MHSHSMNAVLATLLHPTCPVFSCTHLEMMKGIAGHGFYDNMVVPVIENTARECELTERMRAAMLAHPRSNAVLVRRHGVYVWGKTWIEAKTQAECYDYLFGIAVKMAGIGVDASAAPPPKPLTAPVATNGTAPVATNDATPVAANGHDADAPSAKRLRANGHSAMTKEQRRPKIVVLDIEGTVAPIDFVHKTLFPYARKHVEAFLRSTIQEPATRRVAHALLKEINAPSAAAMEALVRSAGAGQAAPGGAVAYLLAYLACHQCLSVVSCKHIHELLTSIRNIGYNICTTGAPGRSAADQHDAWLRRGRTIQVKRQRSTHSCG